MKITEESMVGEIVASDYRTSTEFKKHSIDFCCNGNKTIKEACENKPIETNRLIGSLIEITSTSKESETNFSSWDMDLLADYIEKKHHRYVESRIPEIKAHLKKVVSVHGCNHPELIEIEKHFLDSAEELTKHMKKEELILFPYIRKLAIASTPITPPFGTVENPIDMMMKEHDNEGERFRLIADLSNNYTPPEEACATYTVAFALLKEFEEDLHKHIHLENNILFPKAITTERQKIQS
ncbi:iron-sulfur cluster repair di-iron protein [Aureitalea sp. L0-47]|uniref:iron-sulfur cluster repair di-iron protein n=1 Tax=Aureitalea sp. L0-47 TaxID=2816962 RepID=UPI002238A979|nr:iron-sulfur cluster repair di-iron protein [Aureitalea sp. L0-47]MCW5518804.1 iron-sulfur cluster repair di-iron protein [Aureitalea sp. L0-47]